MSPKIRRGRTRHVGPSRPSKRGVPGAPRYYRYVSLGEAAVIRGSNPQRVPNLDLAGNPKRVYLTTWLFKSAARAEVALQIGAHDPAGPFPSPSDRVRIKLSGITIVYVGIIPGSKADEHYTLASPLVKCITSLGP
jgi:hypothetical protein